MTTHPIPPEDEGYELDEAPAWLVCLLRQSTPPSPGFFEACVRSSEVGADLVKLRRASRRFEAAPLGALDYLLGLAAVARVPIDAIRDWAGLPNEPRLDRPFASAWGRLARAIGLDLREAMVRLRLAFANDLGVDPLPMQARSDADAPNFVPDPADWEVALAREAALWDSEVLARLSECEAALRLAYGSQPPDRR